MKTVLFKTVNKKNIIVGFDDPNINPIETNTKVAEEITKTNIYKQISGINEEIKSKLKAAGDSRKFSRNAQSPQQTKKYHEDFLFRFRQATELQAEIKNLNPEFKKTQKDLIKSKAVYFEVNPEKEKIISEDEYKVLLEKIKTAITNDKVIDIDGKEHLNNIGKDYFKKDGDVWKYTKISDYGIEIPADSFLTKDLSKEQMIEIQEQENNERIKKLSITEKTTEKTSMIESVANQSVNLRSKLEIQGETAAKSLTQSKNFYNSEVEKIEIKYA